MASVSGSAVAKRRLRFIPMVIREKNRKSVFRMIREIIYITFRDRALPKHYFARRMYLEEKKNIRDYLPSKFLYGVGDRINDLQAVPVLADKLFFNLYYGRFLKALPRVLCHNYLKVFVVGDTNYEITTVEEFESLLSDLVKKHSSSSSVFIKKTYDSYGGMNTFRVHAKDLPMDPTTLERMYGIISASAFLFQETLVQHPLVDAINPSCINTIRMDSYVDQDGIPEVLSAYLRVSTQNSHVDNSSSGGSYVGINMDTGTLMRDAYSNITITGGLTITRHPVTGLVFEGYKLPFFDEVKDLVLNAARLVPSMKLIGWDIAITKDGPVLIEGNYKYDITSHDNITGGYRAHPVFRKVLQDLKETRYLK